METKNDFNCSITANINATDATTKIGNLPEWWGVGYAGSSEKPNDTFVIKMGGESFFNFTVEEIIPGKKVVWMVTDCYMPWYNDKKEWTDTKLVFTLNEDNGVTNLNFIHEGLTPEIDCFKDCSTGWTHWIKKSLFSYLTTGKGDFKQS